MDSLQDFYKFLEEIGFAKASNRIYVRSNVSIIIDKSEDNANIIIRNKKAWTISKDIHIKLPFGNDAKAWMLIGSMASNGIFDLNDLETFLTKHV